MTKISCALFFVFFLNIKSAYITYQLSGGRFGDSILAYMHGKWFSYKYKLPFLYTPFPFSEMLELHNLEKNINQINNFNEVILTKNYNEVLNNINQHDTKETIFCVPYFSEDKLEYKLNPYWIKCDVDWDDPEFKNELKRQISPINKNLFKVPFPWDHINVAVHIRRGGGYDGLLLQDYNYKTNIKSDRVFPDIVMPLKFPPFSFYIDSIEAIHKQLDKKRMYVFVFTDDSDPNSLIAKLKKGLRKYKNIIFDCRQTGNHYTKNIVEDFFAMTQFSVLIHPLSNYSISAAKIADYVVEAFPENYAIVDGVPMITKTHIRYKDNIRVRDIVLTKKIEKKPVKRNKSR